MAVEAVRGERDDLRASFRTLSVHESRALLLYGIERRYPVQMVIGRTGSGKSRLLGTLSRTITSGGQILLRPSLPDSLDETIDQLARALSISLPGTASGLERLAALADGLAEHRRASRLVALLIDDAHLLSDIALGNVRLLAGTDAAGGALLPILLAGRPELLTRIASPTLDPLRTAISAHVELLRPLPHDPDDPAPAPAEDGAVEDDRPSRHLQSLGLSVALLGLAALSIALLRLDANTPSAPSPPPPTWSLATNQPDDTAPRFMIGPPPPPVLTAVPETPPVAPSGVITIEAVQAIVAELTHAFETRNVVALERLLASDTRQNGVRGRSRVLETYAYRFSNLDAPMTLAVPDRVVLQSRTALADVPFTTTFRDAAGTPGQLHGVLHLRVTSRAARLVIDSLDYEFHVSAPGTES